MKKKVPEDTNDQSTKNDTEQETSPDERERVGYKKPPRRTQFKPGQSGNPKGRCRIKECLHDRVSRVFLEEIVVRRGDKKEKMTQLEAILHRQLLKATQGDTRAVQSCFKLAEQFGCLKHVFEKKTSIERILGQDEIDLMEKGDLEKIIDIVERVEAKRKKK